MPISFWILPSFNYIGDESVAINFPHGHSKSENCIFHQLMSLCSASVPLMCIRILFCPLSKICPLLESPLLRFQDSLLLPFTHTMSMHTYVGQCSQIQKEYQSTEVHTGV